MTRWLPGAVLMLVAGCVIASDDRGEDAPGAPGSDSFQDDDPPIGCQTGTAGCTPSEPGTPADDGGASEPPGAPAGGSCDNTGQCVDGAVCGATFEDGEAGPLLCRIECIETDDPSAWCSDDSACCSGVCSPRGLCLQGEESDDAGSTSEGTG